MTRTHADDKIAAVGLIVRVNADDAEVIDLTACAVAPGSMDLHVHLMARNATMDANYRYATFEVTPQAHMPHALVTHR
jgi:predicted amidohydrolase